MITIPLVTMQESDRPKRIAVSLPEDSREFLEQEAKETGVPISNLVSYIAVNYVREEKKKRSSLKT
jgi:hypothetical protein